jgi:hypothetical protein
MQLEIYPIRTLKTPEIILFREVASVISSPILAAGEPLIYTVRLPFKTTPPTWDFGSDTGQVCESTIARHAGLPPINTLGLPGPGESGVP